MRRGASGLPAVMLTTALVIGIPLAFVWVLSQTEVVTSLVLLSLIAVGLAFVATRIGEAIARRHGRQLGELMVWGWLRSLFYERRLDRAWTELNRPREMGSREMAERFRELSDALDASDTYTSGHSRRVARYCERIARHLDLDEAQISHLRVAAAIHDVGKINVPAEILRKPAPLTAAEFELVKRHPVDGAELVAQLADPELTRAVRFHHERIDGSGYPDGLAASQIPLEARIIAVADTFDAITSSRPYRPARSRRAALAILHAEAGTKLDRDAVDALATPSLAARSALTAFPERAVAAMGGALNTLSASTAAAIVAAIAVIGIGVTNPAGVANVVRSTPIPGILDAIVPGGGDGSDESEQQGEGREPGRFAAVGATPAVLPPAPSPPGAAPGESGGRSQAGKRSPKQPGGPREPGPPSPGPKPPPPEPGPAPPKPPPEPPRKPELLDPVTNALPKPIGDAVKELTDPLLPPRGAEASEHTSVPAPALPVAGPVEIPLG